ncbi:Lrp/AsnC family transcriptional regulator [Nocardia sp. NPDC101769]|uniref:Lrp/AsnC family transcriptional regulator n=1 Tax=Nocardia sp. NPDC101769 TaxID=3364333 RepID=UPI00380914E2
MTTNEAARTGIDEIDRRIIQELSRDARLSMRELAERTHISRAHAYVRLDHLRQSGVVEGFSARIGYEKTGLRASALVAMSIRQECWPALRTRSAPCRSSTTDNQAPRAIVLERLQGLTGVRSTRTWLIFEEAVGPGPEWV